MARSVHRKHLSKGERNKRGGHLDRDYRDRPLKTTKQKRPNEKTRLKKEHL